MKQIFKFRVTLGRNEIMMPKGFTVLTAQMKDGQIRIWALCDPDMEKKSVEIYVTGTGINIDTDYYSIYVGTVQDGPYVWHVFMHAPIE
jgi:hypothetical protein